MLFNQIIYLYVSDNNILFSCKIFNHICDIAKKCSVLIG